MQKGIFLVFLVFFFFPSFSETITTVITDNLFFNPINDNGNLYFFSKENGNIYAYTLSASQDAFIYLWKSTIEEDISAQPISYNNQILVPGINGNLYAIDINKQGSSVKRIATIPYSIDSLYLDLNKLYVSSRNSLILYTVNMDASLNYKWTYEFEDFDKKYQTYVQEMQNKKQKYVSKNEYELSNWTPTSKAITCPSFPFVFVYKNNRLYKIPTNFNTERYPDNAT